MVLASPVCSRRFPQKIGARALYSGPLLQPEDKYVLIYNSLLLPEDYYIYTNMVFSRVPGPLLQPGEKINLENTRLKQIDAKFL